MNSALTRWAGPVLGLLGGVTIALIALQPLGSRSLVSWWIIERAISAEKALPLIAFGAALSVLSRQLFLVSIIVFLGGAALGFEIENRFIALMAFAPDAADHLFLTAPISSIAAGLLLIAPTRARPWLAAPVASLIGMMLAVSIALTDPTMNSWMVSIVGVALGLWVIVVTALSVQAFYRSWFVIALRILGSWLLAIGLLYGGSSLVKRPALPSLPDENLQAPPPANSLPSLDQPPEPGLPPDGLRADP
jgi:hypothetical protein